jgi:vitamin B12/bleomycin/antimicrobial peptide transport system ATP-binding/permease protein
MQIEATAPRLRPDLRGRSAARAFQAMRRKRRALLFLGEVWALAKPYWQSEERRAAQGLFALLLIIKFIVIWVCIQQNHWYASFYGSIETRDFDGFLKQVGLFGLIACGFVSLSVYAHWLAESLKLRWRDWLVRRTTAEWLTNRTYYRLRLDGESAANPDQRIVEDLGLFAGYTINLVVGFLDVSVSLIAFTSILWGLSGTISIAGVSVAGSMVFAVFGYTFLASWLTHLIGHPLARLHSANRNLESDFRYGLIRLRENAETVAFYGGEVREAALLDARWGKVAANFWGILRRERSISWLTQSHGQFSIVLPFLLSAPRYFSGEIAFAQVMQVAAACGAVQVCLNFFIASYGQIAQWRATTERLTRFRAQLDDASAAAPSEVAFGREGDALAVRGLSLSLPTCRVLVSDFDLAVGPGEAVLVKGPSGAGKSTLLRALAGIWPHARGHVVLPEGETFFVPQKPYLPLGTLREAAFYPALPSGGDQEIRQVLEAVRLGHLCERLDEVDQWSHRLSGGEQQRLGFARVLLARPRTIVLDEATSALDEETERQLYQLLRDAAWRPAIVSIGHRSTLERFHDRVMELKPAA